MSSSRAVTRASGTCGQAAGPPRLEGAGCMSDRKGGRAAEGHGVRQAGDGDPGCHQHREHRCGHPVGEGAHGGQRTLGPGE
ncbi:hypothetical protein QTO34_017408 [Cnephaeus nilssonii]|uniref:Uncharacterized protein n=1 Tax=Cnephaeus nilssonii TaxID=3371016 RepID=A0AA40LR80_CNENI|nr:hypothetical protein QTO34_017408 [Eptesicus nilssonii]